MAKWIFLGVFLGLFLFAAGRGRWENKKNIERLKKEFKDHYGKKNIRQWNAAELETISHYSRDRVKQEEIDALTWMDLDMDEVYRQMAFTASSLGDDYLYFLLKHPEKEEQKLLEREAKIQYLDQQEEVRIRLQVLFAQIGRIKQYSFSDYLHYLMKEKPKSNAKHYLADICVFLSLLLIFYHAGIGCIVFFLCILYNIVSYFKHKALLEPYLVSLRYLLKNLAYAKELCDSLPAEWEQEKKELREILALMKGLQKNSFLLLSPGRMAGEGLELILDYLRMCFHLDIIKFHRMLSVLHQYEKEVWRLYEIMGEWDACIAIAAYRASLPYSTLPVFTDKAEISMIRGYHPLIENAVSNSLEMKRNVLLTGSNASGKSTFLKTMGINILLAQTIHTCMAEAFVLPFCRLYTSMALKDNLALKESYYIAEIKVIKRILDAAEDGDRVICLVDEVLRGTNTVERIAASTQILKHMNEKKIICMAATHDIELTKTLEREYDNYHFEETLAEGDIFFSYQLQKGRSNGCNAIRLLEKLGYKRSLTQNARRMIEKFEEQGEWICG